ncbi:hypothetical protein U14_04849 [Candidatus Moduliflexus flocculans]|uniref:Tagaturonate/fructuronate epimerase n=1 Tax=Candidatus Moduliflexus flocculans TaxID=1499966 RepID=A0A0S6W510_9BACT|nr:hypothetical protein U14_04849 [Candidatus Moduliflexus flocculans]
MTNQQLADYIRSKRLFEADLAQYRAAEIVVDDGLYLSSLRKKGDAIFCIGRDDDSQKKCLMMGATAADAFPNFPGEREQCGEYVIAKTALTHETALFLRQEFSFTAPQPLRGKNATIGMGDRLGLANPAHIKAIRDYDIFPVLAQQSMRELTFTKRTWFDVLDAATFAVFQEGYEDGFGFDGDHLKRLEDIECALECGATMITLDLSDVMNTQAANWSAERLQDAYAQLPETERTRLQETYLAAPLRVGDDVTLTFSVTELQRCCAMYSAAVSFAAGVYRLICARKGAGSVDFEVSIDETTMPTLPEHHLFIVKELIHNDVIVDSLAPRFIGEFQKAIDYIGDLQEFERQLQQHCAIARACGNYKISIHSGSDKFSAYPAIGKWTNGRLHIKTAGTSWLEALRVVAVTEPELYREIHQVALNSYQEALKFYHITADFNNIRPLDDTPDAQLIDYLMQPESRQLLHIIYGFVLQDASLKKRLYQALHRHEALHYRFVSSHLRKHVALLGRPLRDGAELLSIQDYRARYGELKKTWAEIVADSVLATYPHPKDLHVYHPEKWVYQNGFFINALFALWQKTRRQAYFDYIVRWVDLFVAEDGQFKPGKYWQEEYALDNILPGRILIALYRETGAAKYQRAAGILMDQLKNQPRTSDGGYWHKQRYPYQMWLDGIYMADVFSVEFAKVFKQPEHFDDAIHQIRLMYQRAHDPRTGLLFHGWDERKTQVWAHPERGASPEIWGRAVGWYLMALVDCLESLPAEHAERAAVLRILQEVAQSVAACQDAETGLWHQVLDKRDRLDNWLETSCSAMFVYAFAKGVRLGYLDASFSAQAQRAYQSLLDRHIFLDARQRVTMTGVVSVGTLRSTGDYEYYVSSEQRLNDFKGLAAFLYASMECDRAALLF